jgi:hypothetical protein
VLGAWGTWAALGVTTLVLLVMRRRLTEWRTLAVLLSFVWSPFVSPISFAVLLVLMRNTPAWRNLVYVAASIALLPVLFQEYHTYERYGMLLFLLMAAALSVPDADQTEAQIAARSGRPLLPRFVHSYQ